MSEKRRPEPVGTLDAGLEAALGRHAKAEVRLASVLDEHLEEYDRLSAIIKAAESEVTSAYYDVAALEKAIRNTGLIIIAMDGSGRSSVNKEGHLESHRITDYHVDARLRRGSGDDG